MQQNELRAIETKFKQGIEKLQLLDACLQAFAKTAGLAASIKGIDREIGELQFLFSGMRFYVRVRITDRDVDDIGAEFRVPVGWLDWGRFDENGRREAPIQSNYFDERGILCEIEKEEFYCDFRSCDDERVHKGLLQKLSGLVGRTIALNNAT